LKEKYVAEDQYTLIEQSPHLIILLWAFTNIPNTLIEHTICKFLEQNWGKMEHNFEYNRENFGALLKKHKRYFKSTYNGRKPRFQ